MKRKLHYLGAPQQQMQLWIDQGQGELAWAIKSRFLELANLDDPRPLLTPSADTPNLYFFEINTKFIGQPLYGVEVLLLPDKFVVVTLQPIGS